jgi:hypothetical protein
VAAAAQQPREKPPLKVDEPLTMTGCVSPKPGTSGQYTFQDAESTNEYRLNGKGIKKFAGQRVEVVVGSGSKALAVRGGLWPSPNIAARGGDIDPAQESIARQPGGGATGAGPDVPEIRVTRLRGVEGACR